MEKGLIVVIGMTISYVFSLAGMVFAWIYYKKNKKPVEHKSPQR